MRNTHQNRRRKQPAVELLSLTLAMFAVVSLQAADFNPTVKHTRDGNSVEIFQEWVAGHLCKRWIFEYDSTGAVPDCTLKYDFRLERTFYDSTTETWSAWEVEESRLSETAPVASAAGTNISPQVVTHTWTDVWGSTTSGTLSGEIQHGHCPGMTIFERVVCDYGDGNPVPFWGTQVAIAATDTWVHDPRRIELTMVPTVAPGGGGHTTSFEWVTTWPTAAHLLVASTPSHGWSDWIIETGDWEYWGVVLPGVNWWWHSPLHTRTYQTHAGAPPAGPYTVTLTAPKGTKPYYRTYGPSYTLTCTIPD